MKTFNDNAGRTWNVEINVAAIKRVRSLASVNLLEVIEGTLIEKLVRDPVLLADAVTSFDALEHLLTEDVAATLSEMRRVCRAGGRFIFSICTRPSRITVDGQNLHPTVKATEWWLERIARVGHVEASGSAAGGYIAGVFHA